MPPVKQAVDYGRALDCPPVLGTPAWWVAFLLEKKPFNLARIQASSWLLVEFR